MLFTSDFVLSVVVFVLSLKVTLWVKGHRRMLSNFSNIEDKEERMPLGISSVFKTLRPIQIVCTQGLIQGGK